MTALRLIGYAITTAIVAGALIAASYAAMFLYFAVDAIVR